MSNILIRRLEAMPSTQLQKLLLEIQELFIESSKKEKGLYVVEGKIAKYFVAYDLGEHEIDIEIIKVI